jgi:hypothetical protein
MPLSPTVKLGAGSKLFYTTGGGSPVWVELTEALDIGQVGEQGEFVETTPISKTVREYIAGLKTPPQKQLTFNHVPGDTDYAGFLTLVDAGAAISMRVDYTTGDRASFSLVPSGRVMESPEGNSQLKMICFFQQSGGTTWGTAS